MTNHYSTLGVSVSAHADDIRTAFRKAASLYHPDRPGGGDVVKFQAANEAHRVLMDRESRAAYDASLFAPNTTGVLATVSAIDYAEAQNLAPWTGTDKCGFCDGEKEVRVGGAGIWVRKPCPVCNKAGR